ncbi:hypothetical protein [Marinicrinis lubricantis]|uniref:Uncharacterized protein n=1 Tax=Marinicrinis lubricantis TaxID=2086470 RepID=A0ABW1IQX5_9BACL
MDLKKLDMGGKLILASIVVAIISMFFTWVEFIISENGFQQDAYLFLIAFIYPAIQVLRGGKVNKAGGFICAILAVILGIWYISDKSADIFGESINAAAQGPYVFIVAGILLAIGVWKQRA